MDRSSSAEALLICSWEGRAAADSARAEGWLGSLDVRGGDDSPGVGGVGVRMVERVFGSWDDGGGVIVDVVGGAGEVNVSALGYCAGSGESERDSDRSGGLSGLATSVEGMSTESWEVCDKGT